MRYALFGLAALASITFAAQLAPSPEPTEARGGVLKGTPTAELDEPAVPAQDGSATLQVAQRARDNGRVFRLARATVELSGPALLTLDAARADSAFATGARIPDGGYSLHVQPGYVVHELMADGSERAVAAELVGPNPRRLRLGAGAHASVDLAFQIDGRSVRFASENALR
jgi:hypothetical protein